MMIRLGACGISACSQNVATAAYALSVVSRDGYLLEGLRLSSGFRALIGGRQLQSGCSRPAGRFAGSRRQSSEVLTSGGWPRGLRIRALGTEGNGAGAHKSKQEPDLGLRMVSVPVKSSSEFSVSFRLIYTLALYAGLSAIGFFICQLASVDATGGFRLDPSAVISGVVFSIPPIAAMSLLFQDTVVKSWDVANAIRDADDEEASEFFLGMSPFQYLVSAAVAATAEELFYRAAIQGALTHTFLTGSGVPNNLAYGMASLTGYIPAFAPFSQVCAAVVTAAISGSLLFIMASPREPDVIVTHGRSRVELRKQLGVWYEQHRLKQIYPPIISSLLAFYFGAEWVLTGNLLAPIITHTLFYAYSIQTSLLRVTAHQKGSPSLDNSS